MKQIKEPLLEYLDLRLLDIEESDLSNHDKLILQTELLDVKQFIYEFYSKEDKYGTTTVYEYVNVINTNNLTTFVRRKKHQSK